MSTVVAFGLGVLLGVCAIGPMLVVRLRARRHDAHDGVTDAKTGLLSIAAWESRARQELSRAARADATVAVLMIDVDHFKRINDRYGHLVGDGVLRDIAATLTTQLRAYDVIGRFGGDEFVALLPNTTAAAALACAQRVRNGVGTARTEDDLSISIGIAIAPTHGSTVADVLDAADAALYDAKRAGRKQVRIAAGQPNPGNEPR